MGGARDGNTNQVIAILRRCLDEGLTVEIEGLGVFRKSASEAIEFVPESRPTVFIAYAEEDYAAAERLYEDLTAAGCHAWLDKKKLLPGQNWPQAIERAIEVSDFFVACFSRRASARGGHFHSELRWALECAARRPLEAGYFIPVRLDDCRIPARVAREYHWVDLFPDWGAGVQRLLAVLRKPQRGEGRPAA